MTTGNRVGPSHCEYRDEASSEAEVIRVADVPCASMSADRKERKTAASQRGAKARRSMR